MCSLLLGLSLYDFDQNWNIQMRENINHNDQFCVEFQNESMKGESHLIRHNLWNLNGIVGNPLWPEIPHAYVKERYKKYHSPNILH